MFAAAAMCFWLTTSPSAFWLPLKFDVKEVPVQNPNAPNPNVRYLKNHSVGVRSGDRWYTIKRPKAWGNIRILKQGRDGSFLAKYGHKDIYTYWIIYRGRHWPAQVPHGAIVSVDEYTDRNNYLINVIEQTGFNGKPESPPLIYEYKNGASRQIGMGLFNFRVKSGIVVTADVDSKGQVVALDLSSGQESHFLHGSQITRLGGRKIMKCGPDQFLIGTTGKIEIYSEGKTEPVTELPTGMIADHPNSLADFFITRDGLPEHYPADVEGIFYKGEFRKVEMPGVPLEDVSSVSWKSRTSMVLTTRVGGKTRNYLATIKD